MESSEFESVLSAVAKNIIAAIRKGKNFRSGKEFENYFFEKLHFRLAERKIDMSELCHNGPQTFPDVSFGDIGIEVKLSQGESWKTVGNSIREGTKIKGLKKIYLFFLKQGGTAAIKFGLYEDCLSDVVVTHSPRYLIDMEAGPKETIFAKMGVSYENFYGDSAIKQIRHYYAKQGKDVWWVNVDKPSEQITKAYLRDFSDLSNEEKRHFLVDALVLFPQVFSNSNRKFKQVAIYLLENHECLKSNIRDLFTAGGKFSIELDGKTVGFPHIVGVMHQNAKQIKKRLKEISMKELVFYWDISSLDKKDVEKKWLSLIEEHSGDDRLHEVFNSALSS